MRHLRKGKLQYMLWSYNKIKFIVDNHDKMRIWEMERKLGLCKEDIKAIMIAVDLPLPEKKSYLWKPKKEKPKYISQSFERPQAVYDNRQFV
jgi:hypothetical protein